MQFYFVNPPMHELSDALAPMRRSLRSAGGNYSDCLNCSGVCTTGTCVCKVRKRLVVHCVTCQTRHKSIFMMLCLYIGLFPLFSAHYTKGLVNGRQLWLYRRVRQYIVPIVCRGHGSTGKEKYVEELAKLCTLCVLLIVMLFALVCVCPSSTSTDPVYGE